MNLAICTPSTDSYSESFIQAHIEDLRANHTFVYHGGSFPTHLDGESLLSTGLTGKIKGKITGHRQSLQQAFKESLRRNSIDVVLAEYGTTGVRISKICKELGIPLVVHFHGFDASRYSVVEKMKEPYREMFEIASKIIVVSEKMRQMIAALGCEESKMALNHYGPAPYFLTLERGTNEEASKFLAVGRFVDKKAPHLTILAFYEVLKEMPEAKLLMGGEGPLMDACKSLVKALQIGSNVTFSGVLDREQVKELMSEYPVFVQHSIRPEDGDMEGTPVAIVEASASGMAVVATRHAGIPDVIEEGRTGFLVDEFDVNGMAQRMKELARESNLALQMGQAGRERVREHFSMERHIATLQYVLEQASGKL